MIQNFKFHKDQILLQTKISSHSNMDNKGEQKSFAVSDKVNIVAYVDVNIGIHIELASLLRLSLYTRNTAVKNREETGRCVQCGPYSKQQKSLKCLGLEDIESALSTRFKQAHASNASVDGIQLKEKVLHIAAHVGTANCLASSGWIDRFKRHNTVYILSQV